MVDSNIEAPDQAQHDHSYWNSLINTAQAAEFENVTKRCMENWRHRGGGPKYIRVSARCIRYTRRDLKIHNDALLRSSTSDSGQEVAI